MSDLLCAFGAPSGNIKAPGWEGSGHCAGCKAYADQLSAAFRVEVQAGKFDAFGYTAADAKARKPMQLAFNMETSA